MLDALKMQFLFKMGMILLGLLASSIFLLCINSLSCDLLVVVMKLMLLTILKVELAHGVTNTCHIGIVIVIMIVVMVPILYQHALNIKVCDHITLLFPSCDLACMCLSHFFF